jgi:response regulator RpfG family c-di-GMP phosphodiesterase
MIVDDDVAMLNVLAFEIKDIGGYNVVTASSGPEALGLAKENKPDLIVSDYYMPEMNGFELCQKIKSDPALKHSMFVLLTAESSIERKVEGLDIGADEFLTKPFKTEELLARIRSLLRIKLLQDEVVAERKELERLHKLLQENFNNILALLSELIGTRVPNASLRAERAVQIVHWVVGKMNIDEAEANNLHIAARLREVGKLNLPDEVLRKPETELTGSDREILSHAPVYAEAVVNNISTMHQVAQILRWQFENFDGTGFPDRLRASQIPLGARLLRAVNMLDQLIDQGMKNPEDLIVALAKHKGTILEPKFGQLIIEYMQTQIDPNWLQGKRQVSVYDLKQGMKLACDIHTGKGLKLIQKDTTITKTQIERILTHNEVDPIITTLYIYN